MGSARTSVFTYRRNARPSVKHRKPAWLASVTVAASSLSITATGWLSSSWIPLGHARSSTAYLTFSSSQKLVIVPEVRDKLLDAWGIDAGVRVGEFTREQSAYLEYHRANVFKHSLLEP
jgi:hypothetical protein